MARFFSSFDEAWRSFLEREEELEDFFAQFPEAECFLLGWLLPLDDRLMADVKRVQELLSRFDWITCQPGHFLHTWIASVALHSRPPTSDAVKEIVERAQRAWAGVTTFEIAYPRINCFHTAVIAEVEGDGPRDLVTRLIETDYWKGLPAEGAMGAVPLEAFLPHLTLGPFNRSHGPGPLREALIPVRETALGEQRVSEATLCLMPASRSTILRPWEVVASIAFE
jgi:hypothetical protein